MAKNLGKFLYEALGKPNDLHLYGIGIGEVKNRNEEELEELSREVSKHTKTHTYKVSDREQSRADTIADIFKMQFKTSSLLVIPETTGLDSSETVKPAERYKKITDLTKENNLRATLHRHVEEDLMKTYDVNEATAIQYMDRIRNELEKSYDDSYIEVLEKDEEKLLFFTQDYF